MYPLLLLREDLDVLGVVRCRGAHQEVVGLSVLAGLLLGLLVLGLLLHRLLNLRRARVRLILIRIFGDLEVVGALLAGMFVAGGRSLDVACWDRVRVLGGAAWLVCRVGKLA